MTNIPALRKEIKAQFPSLQFKVRTVSFEDLARCSRVFVESSEWGTTKGNAETYEAVRAIAKKHGAIVSW